jgi:flagellar assembly factor FliW
VTDPEVSFTCMDAVAVKMDYEVPLDAEVSAALSLASPEDAAVLVIVTVPAEDPRRMTANLAGPLVVNTRTWMGHQVVLDSRIFPRAYKVFSAREETILEFPAGLIGYPGITSYRLLEPADGYPLKFLQATERDDISFVCIDVSAIKPDYVVPMSDADAREVAIESPDEALILALVVLPPDPDKMTANLAGPLVVNTRTLKARQIVLNIDQYPLAYPVFPGK